jgi:hypothetical protein
MHLEKRTRPGVGTMNSCIWVVSVVVLWLQAAHGTDAAKQKWLNVPDTPLRFTLLANEYTLALTNVSNKATQRHTLGCVSRESHKVIRKLRTVAIPLDPGKSSAGNLDSYGGDLDTCESSHSALAVIGATFADGQSWRYNPKSRWPAGSDF